MPVAYILKNYWIDFNENFKDYEKILEMFRE